MTITYQTPRNGFGTASLVLGICALVVPIFGWVLPLIGIPLGFAGLSRCKAGTANNRGTALWGIWLSVVALVLWLVLFTVLVNSVS